MAQYRIVFSNYAETAERRPEIFECEDDNEAIRKAVDLLADRFIEIWNEDRLIMRMALMTKAPNNVYLLSRAWR
jgi:hypothetical protein